METWMMSDKKKNNPNTAVCDESRGKKEESLVILSMGLSFECLGLAKKFTKIDVKKKTNEFTVCNECLNLLINLVDYYYFNETANH